MLFTRWQDFDRTLGITEEATRRLHGNVEVRRTGVDPAAWPMVNLYDEGERLVVLAEVPGLRQSDLTVTVDREVLTLEGARKPLALEGRHVVHRRERSAVHFVRSVVLPVPVDVEHATASVKDGVLTVALPKAVEARPRRIAVNAAN